MKRCVLLSGGLDSIAVSYWQKPELAITIDYGQAAAQAEITAATQVAQQLNMQHAVIRSDCTDVGLGEMSRRHRTSPSPPRGFQAPTPDWWPFRNQLLVTLAAAYCVVRDVNEILVGSVRTDAMHKDGERQFYELLDRLVSFQEGHLCVVAPAIEMTSAELIRTADVPVSLLGWAHSCHHGDLPCGTCRGCVKYQEVWYALRSG